MAGDFPSPSKLPVINFSDETLHPGTTTWLSTRHLVRVALEEYGCFVAEYEKFPQELHDAIFHDCEELFDLPTETKMKNTSDKPYHGYLSNQTALFIPPLHESLGIDSVPSFEAVDTFTKLMWPSGNHHFCEKVISYSKIVIEMDQLVKRMVFESYGVEKHCESHIASTNYQFKAIKYRVPQIGEENIGAHAHTDKSFMTILHQNEVNGLEIKTKNGSDWLGVEFSPNSFLVMAGDACLAWSNGRIHSATHRVIMKGIKERYSIGLFALHKGTIEIPSEMVDELHPLKFKPFNNYGLLDYFSTAQCSKMDSSTAKAYCGVN